jgi:tetratricopeptide (TPR) repeat protein
MVNCPIDEYLEKFEEEKESLLKNPRCLGEDNLRNLPVYATFNISYEAIKAFADKRREIERAPEATYALQLLHLLCFYHNEGSMGTMFHCAGMMNLQEKRSLLNPLRAEGVLLDHFLQHTCRMVGDQLDLQWQSRCFDLGIGFLEEFSLIKYDYHSMYSNMHILVHEWARGRMTKGQRAEWGLAARRIVIDSLDEREGRAWVMHRREMLPHVDACLKFVGGEDLDPKLEAELLFRIARLYDETDRPEAETAYLRALDICIRKLGYLDEWTLRLMRALAKYYDSHNRDDEAEALYLETIDRMTIREKERHWRAAQGEPSQKSEPKSPQESAKPRQAEPLDYSALRSTKVFLARFYSKLDRLYDAQKHTGDIIAWSLQFPTTDTGDKRVDDKDVVRARECDANMAGQLPSFLKLPEARRAYLEAKKAHGPHHFETIWKQRVLGFCLVEQGQLKEAEDHLSTALTWYSETYGPDSKEALDVLMSIATCFRAQGRSWESAWLAIEAQLKYDDKFGPTHDKTMYCALEAARAYHDTGLFERAIQVTRDILDVRRETLGPDHPRTRRTADMLQKFKSTAETLPLFLRIRWMQQELLNAKVALEKGSAYHTMPSWLKEWTPVPVEPMLTADGTEVRYVMDTIKVEGGIIERWRALDEAAFVPDQKLTDVLPPNVTDLLPEASYMSDTPRARTPNPRVEVLPA